MLASRPGLLAVMPAVYALFTGALAIVAASSGAPLWLTAVVAIVSASLFALVTGLLTSVRVRSLYVVWIPVARRTILTVLVALIAVAAATGKAPIALTIVLVGIALFEACILLFLLVLTLQGKMPEPKEHPMAQWWYNNKTGEVEEGPQSLGSDRDGPFETREDAARAPEIIAERARRWAAEDD